MSQNSDILKHLKRRPITAIQALNLYGVFRLAARINDLRERYNITTITVTRNNKRVAKYVYEGELC